MTIYLNFKSRPLTGWAAQDEDGVIEALLRTKIPQPNLYSVYFLDEYPVRGLFTWDGEWNQVYIDD